MLHKTVIYRARSKPPNTACGQGYRPPKRARSAKSRGGMIESVSLISFFLDVSHANRSTGNIKQRDHFSK